MKSNKLYLPHRTWIHRPYDPHKRPKYHTDKAHLSQNTWICTRCSTLQNCWIWTRNPTSLLHPKAPNFQSLYSTLHHSPTPRHLQLTSETLKLCFCCLWAPQRGTRRPNRTKRTHQWEDQTVWKNGVWFIVPPTHLIRLHTQLSKEDSKTVDLRIKVGYTRKRVIIS